MSQTMKNVWKILCGACDDKIKTQRRYKKNKIIIRFAFEFKQFLKKFFLLHFHTTTTTTILYATFFKINGHRRWAW